MITVKELMEALAKLPADAIVQPYEGEIIGIVVLDSQNDENEIAFFQTGER